jgi:signal transduction histidine kinase
VRCQILRNFAGEAGLLGACSPFSDTLLVSITRSGSSPDGTVVAVRLEGLQALVEEPPGMRPLGVRLTSGMRVAGSDPLSPSLPGLGLLFPETHSARLAQEDRLLRWFYVAALLLVLSLTASGGYLFGRDIQRELRIAGMRSAFVSSVSHELKTPLTAIRMFAETLLMRRTQARTEVQEEYLETIVNDSERLSRLIGNVLDFSNIEQGRKTYRLEPQPLHVIVSSAAKLLEYPLAQQGFELRMSLDDELPHLPVDRDGMEQAVLNLLSNAMKYSGAARVIDLRLYREGSDAVIAVTDQGAGIPEHEQVRIFERFYRSPSVDSQQIPGTGLGLTIVEHLTRAHGGRVAVESAPDQGSTFSIRLPVPLEPNAPANTGVLM